MVSVGHASFSSLHLKCKYQIHPVLYAAIEADDSGTLRAPRGRGWQSLADAFRPEAPAIRTLRTLAGFRLSSGHSGELRHPRTDLGFRA